MIGILAAAHSSFGGILLAVVIVIAFLVYMAWSSAAKTCPHCGHTRNNPSYPVCKKCGRNRRTG